MSLICVARIAYYCLHCMLLCRLPRCKSASAIWAFICPYHAFDQATDLMLKTHVTQQRSLALESCLAILSSYSYSTIVYWSSRSFLRHLCLFCRFVLHLRLLSFFVCETAWWWYLHCMVSSSEYPHIYVDKLLHLFFMCFVNKERVVPFGAHSYVFELWAYAGKIIQVIL